MINLYGRDNEAKISIRVEQNHFPDNTLLLKLPNHKIDKVEWLYENDAELFTLICIRKHYDKDLALILPYIPHARQDRVKNSDDVFTLKYFCEVINSLNFSKVVVRDAHSNVALALLNRVYQEPIDTYIYEVLKDMNQNTILFFPDEGAMKRYSNYFHIPYAFGMKKRNWETGKIEGLDVINKEIVKDKNILIIDDICSRGGTFLYSAKALKEAGAKDIYLYITHAENTMVEGEMYNDSNLIKHIYTTNSIFDKSKDTLNKVSIIH